MIDKLNNSTILRFLAYLLICFFSKMLRSLLYLFTFVYLFSFADDQSITIPEDNENFHIFLLMGQSNMEGGSSIDGDMDTTPHPRIWTMNAWDSWVQSTDPITNNKNVAVGPGFAFAKKMVQENEDISIGLIPLAVGGTPISLWMKGSDFYNATLSAASIGRINGVIKGILWHQGEHDSFMVSTAVSYAENLRILIDDLRIDMRDSNLPFIVGGLVDSPWANDYSKLTVTVWNRLKDVGTRFYRTGYVKSVGAPYLPDYIHFSTEGQRIMGERYANEYLRIIGHWTEVGKKLLDESAVELEGGWKYHDLLGVYYDANFPIIKHAQLGWFLVDVDEAMTIRIDSPLMGKFTILSDDSEKEMYIARENIDDPEYPVFETIYWVNLLSDSETDNVFYNHTTQVYSKTIEGMPAFDSIEDYYYTAEQQFVLAQQALADLKIAIDSEVKWSEMMELVRKAEEHRQYTLLYSREAYRYASENVTDNLKSFWMNQSEHLISEIDSIIISAQEAFERYTETLING